MNKKIPKLTKSSNRIVFGVCGGIGDLFKIDPTIIRFIWILVTVFTKFIPGIILYIIASVIIPETSPAQNDQAH